jgi:hypothetical protein
MVGNFIGTVIHQCNIQVHVSFLTKILQWVFVQTVELPHHPADAVSGNCLLVPAGGNHKNNAHEYLRRRCFYPVNSKRKLTYRKRMVEQSTDVPCSPKAFVPAQCSFAHGSSRWSLTFVTAFVGNGELVATSCAASCQNLSAVGSAHPVAETVFVAALAGTWIIGWLHG